MPILSDVNEQFALSISGDCNAQWTLQLQETVATPQNVGSATNDQNFDYEGVDTSEGVTLLGAPGVTGFTLEMTYFSLVNNDASTQQFSFGKSVNQTYYQISPTFTLAKGWSMIYVAGAGWTAYDANGIAQSGSSTPSGPSQSFQVDYTFTSGDVSNGYAIVTCPLPVPYADAGYGIQATLGNQNTDGGYLALGYIGGDGAGHGSAPTPTGFTVVLLAINDTGIVAGQSVIVYCLTTDA